MEIRKYFSFKGRITRSQYWASTLLFSWGLFFAVGLLSTVIVGILETMFEENPPAWILVPLAVPIFLSLLIVPIWTGLAANIKRLHDHDMSGWWQLVLMIPILGWFVSFVLLGCTRGTEGPNRYGSPAPRRNAPPDPQK